MKKLVSALFFSAALMFSCSSQKNSHSYYSSYDSNGGTHSITINDDNGSLAIKYAGEISFNESETGIDKISENGFLKYAKNGKKITVTPGDNGKPFYEINGGAKKQALSDDEAILVANAIKTMIGYGIGAKDRVQRIYAKNGTDGVLTEVHKLKSDFVKSIYLEYLVTSNKVTGAEMKLLADNIRTEINADFEKANLLKKVSNKYLQDPAISQAYLDAVKSIGSDFEKANAVKKLLAEPLSTGQFTEVLAVSMDIHSDFEKANVLKSVLEKNDIPADQFTQLLKAVGSINSDFEKANVLKQVLSKGRLPEQSFNQVFAVANNINSDFEKANLLKEVLTRNDLPEAEFNTALNAIININSDFEKANVLKLLTKTKIKTDDQWITLLNTSEKMSSDFEKSNLLIAIADKMPGSDNVKGAYLKAAKSIGSDFEYGKVMRAVK